MPDGPDLTPLTELDGLVSLALDVQTLRLGNLAPLTGLRSLKHLGLNQLAVDRLSEIVAHPGVSTLTVTNQRPLALDGLDAWTSLRNLEISEPTAFDDTLATLREHPRITRLSLTSFPWAHQPDWKHPLCWSSPRASMGLRIEAASMAPSAAPAPTSVWSSSMNRMMSPRVRISLRTFFRRSSKSPRYREPATRAPRLRV
ncbi:hypothetical protein SBADM41S_03989 [Streptomyces badius]